MNSLLTVNSVMHALWLCPIRRTHYMWRATLTLFLLYRELVSDHELVYDRELFNVHELRDARTLAPPHVTHTLCVASSARSFSIVL